MLAAITLIPVVLHTVTNTGGVKSNETLNSHIRTVQHLDYIKVLFIRQLMH